MRIDRTFVQVCRVPSRARIGYCHRVAQTPTEPVVDHIHLGVPDIAKGVEWYQKALRRGQPVEEGRIA